MIQKYIDKFMAKKPELEAQLSAAHPGNYQDLVTMVINQIEDSGDYFGISSENIHEINDGDYQGTLVYVISNGGYQPSEYYYVKVGYGSCGHCDTLQSIRDIDWTNDMPNRQQVSEYMQLALHIVQGLRKMGEWP